MYSIPFTSLSHTLLFMFIQYEAAAAAVAAAVAKPKAKHTKTTQMLIWCYAVCKSRLSTLDSRLYCNFAIICPNKNTIHTHIFNYLCCYCCAECVQIWNVNTRLFEFPIIWRIYINICLYIQRTELPMLMRFYRDVVYFCSIETLAIYRRIQNRYTLTYTHDRCVIALQTVS